MKRLTELSLARISDILVMLLWMLPVIAGAQPGFQTLDPFYQDESARRDFYSNVAISGEVGYRTTSLLQTGSEAITPGLGSVVVSAQLDYALMRQVDVSGIIDLTGGVGQGAVGLSWVVIKPYWHNSGTDYAVRIAVDPTSEGSLGFRQTDVAFLSTSTTSPTLVSSFAVGVRRVRTGYDSSPLETDIEDDALLGASADFLANANRTRIIGRELHVSWGYSFLFDPAGSRVAVSLLGEAGDYSLLRPESAGEDLNNLDSEARIRSGMAWLRAGIELNRPSYQLSPYLSVPIATWANVEGEGVRHGPRPDKAQFGLRVTFR